jgi:prepilin-type N-terminal cleavage/methylation domain-containing protein
MRPSSAQPHASPDRGFSFVELLVALSLLLITLIAVMGLSMTSSFMATTARQRAAMVNAGAGYLERVRQMPYGTIGTPSGVPTGTLVATTTTSAPYIITVTPSVTWGRPEDPANHHFKTVTLSVISSKADGSSPMTYSTSAVVGDVGPAASRPDPHARSTTSGTTSASGTKVASGCGRRSCASMPDAGIRRVIV